MGKRGSQERPITVSRRKIPFRAGPEIIQALEKAPPFCGESIRLSYAPALRAWRGKLLPNGRRGTEVHAGSFLRERRMVLDSSLHGDPGELSRILCHELAHFVWVRLGNATRQSWRELLIRECTRQTPGELGWSAQMLKESLPQKAWLERPRLWRDYTCESFCDTAAWLWGASKRHEEFTLSEPDRRNRSEWFANFRAFHEQGIPL